jgi:transcriptional regulator with XRE-family HTH domain
MTAPRVCSACRTTRLSRFNAGTVCAPCQKAARDLGSVVPTWLWDSVPMRLALARLDPGSVLAIFRAVSGLSQQDVADMMGWSQSTVSLIEKGQRDTLFDLRELLRFADMVEMPREALAPVLAGQPDASLDGDALEEPGDDVDDDVNRRDFAGLAAGLVAAAVVPEPATSSRVTLAHVRYLQACADSLNGRDQAVGGAALLRQALRQRRRARRMLDEADYTEAVGRELLLATGNLTVCAGWLAFDAANIPLARQLFSEALLLAGSAGDVILSAHVLEKSSMLSSYIARSANASGRAREGLRLADQAADAARHAPMPRLHTLIALRRANAASLMGDHSTFRSAINRARRELDHGVGKDDPAWIRFVDESEITGQEAMGYMNLGAPDKAALLHSESLERACLPPRNRACASAQLAAARAGSGDAAGAVAEGNAVLPALAEGVASLRTLNELRPVRAAAHSIGAEDFCTRFDAVEKGLNT